MSSTPRQPMALRVLGLIPARGGSRRLRRKNLARFGGKTLVRRALETAADTPELHTVALSSEDPEILAQANGLEAVMPIERPSSLAADASLAYDVVMHALAQLERGDRFDAVAIIQCTSPFTTPYDIAGTIGLLERTGAGSAVTVVEVDHMVHPLKLQRLEGDRLLPLLEGDGFVPADELPKVWVRNGSIYVTRRDVLRSGALLSDDVRGYPMPRERSHDINTDTDLAFAEFMLQRMG